MKYTEYEISEMKKAALDYFTAIEKSTLDFDYIGTEVAAVCRFVEYLSESQESEDDEK